MQQIRLRPAGETDAVVTLAGRAPFDGAPVRLAYPTRTGALVRIDGAVAAAFDGKHATCDLTVAAGEREIVLEVEKRSLPISNLPAGDGLKWRLLLARATQAPHGVLDAGAPPAARPRVRSTGVRAFGHAHLDVAWLWRFVETRRKALRTFATALRQIENGAYVFAQSMPQLYAWVEADDPELFARVRERIGRGFDASVATMWVEPDLHAPSGESILRQFAYGMGYARTTLGADPRVVWLPDTFGFPNTLAQLAVHAGARAFATTKLQWNETTRWPYPQFAWHGDDGSVLPAAVFASYDGDPTPARIATARERGEPLVVGFGDGGGGATDAAIAAVDPAAWTTLGAWFDALDPAALPAYTGELYLETHRGTYTTHRDVKSRNAALERALAVAEEAAAWCVAVRLAPAVTAPLRDDLRNAWTIVLRNQFHDVLAGTSLGSVYADVHAEYDRADAIVARVRASAESLLPRAQLVRVDAPCIEPQRDGTAFVFENEYLRARVTAGGTVVDLNAPGGPNVVAIANGLAAYVDRPKTWDAWNLDASYVRKAVRVRPRGATLDDGGLVVRFRIGRASTASMRIELRAGEPFLRVAFAVDWRESHVVLRVEHRLAVDAPVVRYGAPHGTLVRPARPATPAERARFEVPAQRFAHVDDGTRGCAIFAPDSYGWSAAGLKAGGVRIGMSLLRSPRWPDPAADRGEHRIEWALAPTAGAPVSALEAAWEDYAGEARVRLFTTDDPGVAIVATKPADDGNGVIVRVRECDGDTHDVALRCGGRMRAATAVDACERPLDADVAIEGETLAFTLPAFALRTFRVTF